MIVWEGDQHIRALMVEPVPPLDFVLSAAPDLPLDPRASYVAEAQLRALFAPSLDPLASRAPLVASADGAAILVAGTPPPIGEVDAIAARLARDPQFAALIASGRDAASHPTVTLTSPYTLQKVWSLLQLDAGRDRSGERAPCSFRSPDRTRNLEGFLAPAIGPTIRSTPMRRSHVSSRVDLHDAAAQLKEPSP